MYIFYTELNPCSFHGVCRKKKFIALCSSSVECVWLPHWHIHNIQNTHTRNTNERCTVHTLKNNGVFSCHDGWWWCAGYFIVKVQWSIWTQRLRCLEKEMFVCVWKGGDQKPNVFCIAVFFCKYFYAVVWFRLKRGNT